jgi:protein-tyrosine phosphatase
VSGFSYLTADHRLAQGSAPPPGVRLPFEVVVLAAEEYQPELPGFTVLRVPLDDGPPPDKATRLRIREAARRVGAYVQGGQRVLVTCFAGRNRSGVIAGLALRQLGVPGDVAARRIRQLRDGLTNPYFYAMVVT